jgi:hypothetical protein
VANERRPIPDLIDHLADAQLATPSLCGMGCQDHGRTLVSVFADSSGYS